MKGQKRKFSLELLQNLQAKLKTRSDLQTRVAEMRKEINARLREAKICVSKRIHSGVQLRIGTEVSRTDAYRFRTDIELGPVEASVSGDHIALNELTKSEEASADRAERG